MKNRGYRFRHNSCRDEDRRQAHRPDQRSEINYDCLHRDRQRSSQNRFDLKEKSRVSGNRSQFNSTRESQSDRCQSYGGRRGRNNKFNFKNRNSHNCSQSHRSRGGW